jgi:hypothetical protein
METIKSVSNSIGSFDFAAVANSIDLNQYRDANGKITCPVSQEVRDQLKYAK